ncbi:MAG: transporter suffix domain-containing protein [Planctomycetales bacterium]|jgi:hypothetical protein
MTNRDPPPDRSDDQAVPEQGIGSTAARIGVMLILLSGVLWFSLFAIPFLPLTIGQKAAIAGADFVAVQIAWWIGAAMAGSKLVARLKSRFRRRKSTDES